MIMKKKSRCYVCKHTWEQHNTDVKGDDPICLVDRESDPNKEDFCPCTWFMTKEQFMNDKFKRRYVLAEGWPLPHYSKGVGIKVMMQSREGKIVHIQYPVDTDFADNDAPKYRLVLERIT